MKNKDKVYETAITLNPCTGKVMSKTITSPSKCSGPPT